MQSMNELGLFTGLLDANGLPIQLGDTLSFDPKEWGNEYIFQLVFEDGGFNIGFSVEDLSEHCTIIKKYND